MQHFIKTLHQLQGRLEEIKSNAPNPFSEYENCINACRETLTALREGIEKNGFRDQDQECNFFKTIKPEIVGYFYHYINLGRIEKLRPIACGKTERKWIIAQIDTFQAYFLEHPEFYEYYRFQRTDKDHDFFLRKGTTLNLHHDTIAFLMDANFSTSHDMILAKFLGNLRTISFLQQKLQPAPANRLSPLDQGATLQWTGQKVDLVELIYALQASGVVNNGNIGIRQFGSILGQVFNIDLGDCYRTFQEIKLRKSNPSKLLDLLKTSLHNRIIETDS